MDGRCRLHAWPVEAHHNRRPSCGGAASAAGTRSAAFGPTGGCWLIGSPLSRGRKEPLGDHLPQDLAERSSVAGRELLPEGGQLARLAGLLCGRGGACCRDMLGMGFLLALVPGVPDTSVPAA